MKNLKKYILIIPAFLFLVVIFSSKAEAAFNPNCRGQGGTFCTTGDESPGPCEIGGAQNCCYSCTTSGWVKLDKSLLDCGTPTCGSSTGGKNPPPDTHQTGTPCDPKTEICNTAVPGLFSEPEVNLSNYLNAIITFVFIIGFLVFFFMLIFGGVQWITSGGDKQGTQSARGRLTAALIGLAILAFSWAIITLAENFFGINILNFAIPHP